MTTSRAWVLMAGAALLAAVPTMAHGRFEVGSGLVAVAVEIDGRPAPLYAAPDGSGRHYLEARPGSRYAVTLANRGGERLGVVLTVDGLNAISGERDQGRGRMYVLDPWQTTRVQGWRTSLRDVRQFTFVDEKRSYAARSGKANEKMGWIELAVYRERRAFVQARPAPYAEPWRSRPGEPTSESPDDARAQAPAAPEAESARDEAASPAAGLESRAKRERSYPGTGWGRRAHDPVVVVSFDPEPSPSERVTLRYEYRPALVALGVLPETPAPRGRLWQREHAEPGFAQPPRW